MCTIHTTDNYVMIINDEQQSILFDDYEVRLANCKTVRANSGHTYFVERENRSQTSFVVEVSVSYDKQQVRWNYSRRRVYTILSDVLTLQLERAH